MAQSNLFWYMYLNNPRGQLIIDNTNVSHTGLCHADTGSDADLEAALDPLLCHYQGPIGSLLRREHMLPLDQSEAFTGQHTSPWIKTFRCFYRFIVLCQVWLEFTFDFGFLFGVVVYDL